MVVFEANYDEIKLQNIVMTSFQWRHHHYEWSWVNNLMVFKKIGLGLEKVVLVLKK